MFYVLDSVNIAEEYVIPREDDLMQYERPCRMSEYQYLDHSQIDIEISDEGGIVFPDFIYRMNVPLISERMKKILDSVAVDNLFYKPVSLTLPILGIREAYYIALPPRIRCLDLSKTVINSRGYASNPVIINKKVGNYKIFKLAASSGEKITNNEIFITGELKETIEGAGLTGIIINTI